VSISQLLPTHRGDSYDLAFLARSMSGTGKIALFWDDQFVQQWEVGAGPVSEFSWNGLPASAAGTRLTLWLTSSVQGGLALDDVAVQPAVAMPVPEARTATMLLVGLGVLGLMQRRRAQPRFT
jgi:hypothetical protein